MMFAIVITFIFLITIGITVFNVKEASTNGKWIHDRDDFSYLLEKCSRPMEAELLIFDMKIFFYDVVIHIRFELLYNIFEEGGILARSARFFNQGKTAVHLLAAMSLTLDLPDKEYIWMQMSGSWGGNAT